MIMLTSNSAFEVTLSDHIKCPRVQLQRLKKCLDQKVPIHSRVQTVVCEY